MTAPSWACSLGAHQSWSVLEHTPGAGVAGLVEAGGTCSQTGKGTELCCEPCTAPRTTAVQPGETPQWYCSSGTVSTGPEEPRAKRVLPFTPSTKKDHCPHTLALLGKHIPKKTLKLKFTKEREREKQKCGTFVFSFFSPFPPCLLWTY